MEGFDAGLADSSGFAEGFTAGALGFPATTGTGFEGACADAVADADADADAGTLATGAALWLTVLWRPRSGLALRLAALAAALGLLLLELPHLYLGAPAVTVGSVVVAACLLVGGTTRLLLGER